MRAFLDIDIGDASAYQQHLEAYNRAEAFLSANGSQYGLAAALLELDAEGIQMLQEAYSNDPIWSAKGAMSPSPPAALRAGRIIAELFVSEVTRRPDKSF